MLPTGYYAWDNQAKVSKTPIHSSDKDVASPPDVESEGTEIVTRPGDGTSETTDPSVRVIEFDVAHYLYYDMLPPINRRNYSEIQLRDISDTHLHSLL